MKKIHIKSKIISELNGETITDIYGEYNESKNIITYIDKSVNVCVIIGKKITIQRKSDDYNMNLIFDEESISNTIYEIYNPKMLLDIDIETKLIKRKHNNFYIEYELSIGKESMGKFSIDFKWEE